MARHALPPNARLALEVIAHLDADRIPVADYEREMTKRGAGPPNCGHAIVSLCQRRWVTTDGSMITVSDTGWLAATRGGGARQPAVSATETGSTRRLSRGRS